MTFADCVNYVSLNGEKNTLEGFRLAHKVGWISAKTMNELLEKHHLILQEVAA